MHFHRVALTKFESTRKHRSQQRRDVATLLVDYARQLAQQPNNQPVKVTLDFFRPTPPTAQVLNTIQSDTTQIRLQGTAPH